jgi:hypothetical protein
MPYQKPEVTLLGDASLIIQAIKFDITGNEGIRSEVAGVYDPEE